MKTAVVLLVMLVMLVAMVGPSEAWVRGGFHHRGGFGHGGWGWWWPGAIVGGLALGAVAGRTDPYYYAPPPAYAAPPVVYQSAPTYAAPAPPAVQREVSY